MTFVHRLGGGPVNGDLVIALTAPALAECLDAGIVASVVDDYVNRQELFADWRRYIAWQLGWFGRLDAETGGTGAPVAAALALRPPVDGLVMTARILAAVLDRLSPHSVVYLGSDPSEPDPWYASRPDSWPTLGNPPLAARLLPLLCRPRHISLRLIFTGPAGASGSEALVARLKRNQHLQAARVRARELRAFAAAKRTRDGRTSTLMLTTLLYGADRFARHERRMGQRVLYAKGRGRGAQLLEPRWNGLARVASVQPQRSELQMPAEAVALLREIDEWAGETGAGDLLIPRLEGFLTRLCAEIDGLAVALEAVLDRLCVSRVVATNPDTVVEYAALLAAGRNGAHRVLIQHGDHAMPYDSWLVTETQNFEEMVCSDPTVAPDLEAAARNYAVPCPAFSFSSPRLPALRSAAFAEPVLCYVPGALNGDFEAVGSFTIGDAWYHCWQRRLLEVFASYSDRAFLWKAFPLDYFSPDPMERVLSAGPRNVRYTRRWLPAVFPYVSHVLVDFPSTPLYEAVRAGKRTLGLSFSRFLPLRPSARDMLGESLRECLDVPAALAHVEDFIASLPGTPDPERTLGRVVLHRPRLRGRSMH